jgi:hypothetical protein
MSFSPLALARRHVLGDHYSRCDRIGSIPVYLDEVGGEVLGSVDEGLGHYADAFLFHLSEEHCKKLSTGHFTYSFDCKYKGKRGTPGRRMVLNSITLTSRKNYEKPLPRREKHDVAAVEIAAEIA